MSDSLTLELVTGSRLHFGLMEVCSSAPNCYAGLGLMLQDPSMRIRLRGIASGDPQLNGVPTDYRSRVMTRVEQHLHRKEAAILPAEITIENPLPLHHGLGAGTQLSCSLAAALEIFERCHGRDSSRASTNGAWEFCGDLLGVSFLPSTERVQRLADISGRGLRSAIGLHGFLDGGLIVDHGLSVREESNKVVGNAGDRQFATRSLQLPEHWRLVLICPKQDRSVSGLRESRMLQSLARHPNPNRERMLALAECLAQCVRSAAGLPQFASLLDEYTNLAGRLFAAVQGGLYSSLAIASAVAQARASGLVGVGQSSWGPTVFGFAESQEQAIRSRHALQENLPGSDCRLIVTRPANRGAGVRCTRPSANKTH